MELSIIPTTGIHSLGSVRTDTWIVSDGDGAIAIRFVGDPAISCAARFRFPDDILFIQGEGWMLVKFAGFEIGD